MQAIGFGGSRVAQPSRDAGTFRGSLAGWHGPQSHSKADETREREVMQRRMADLFTNDWAARSGVDTIANNAVGTGLVPQVRPAAKLLGISGQQARDFAHEVEWYWNVWTKEAHFAKGLHFSDLQHLGILTLLKFGEMLHVPVMLSEKERIADSRTFSLCLQNLAPQRLLTPSDYIHNSSVHDGVHMSAFGKPLGYYVALPNAAERGVLLNTSTTNPLSSDCVYVPARVGHRPGIFHLFRNDTDEQVRGVSPLATGARLFRHLADALDYELYAQVIAAAFPVFFANEHPPASNIPYSSLADGGASEEKAPEIAPYQNIEPGSMLYGAVGEKPEILESKRPSQNFVAFVEIILRAQSACLGIPYESLSKDFSKTNYSSARAALNEAWKTYLFYRQWFARLYCQRIFDMFLEEAYLRNIISFPKSKHGFYEARHMWSNTRWVGPARGFVDPVKEINATVMALDNKLMTYGEAWAERGGDFDEGLEVMREEKQRMADLLPSTEGLNNE